MWLSAQSPPSRQIGSSWRSDEEAKFSCRCLPDDMSFDSRSRVGAVVIGECEARILSWQGEEMGTFPHLSPLPAKRSFARRGEVAASSRRVRGGAPILMQIR